MRRLLTTLVGTLVLCSWAVPANAFAPNDPAFGRQWGMTMIGAPQAWDTGTGAGVTIAIVDTGVDLHHEDLPSGKFVPGYDFVDQDADPQDAYGHGTHVAGIAAAATNNFRGVVGVAPDAKIMPVRVLDSNGSGTGADIDAGIHWAADHGAQVINLSLSEAGQQVFGPGFSDAIQYAWDHGAIPVVAAGNQYVLGSGFSNEPAMVVSAVDRNQQKPSYSDGVGSAKWGIAAPGGTGNAVSFSDTPDDIFSTYWQSGKPNVYAYDAGTSMSAPHVSGAAAILRGLGLSKEQTVDRLLKTAKDIGAQGQDSTFGWGLLDVAAAVRGLRPASGGGATTGGSSPKTGSTSSGGTSAAARSSTVAKPTPQPPTGPSSVPGSTPVPGAASSEPPPPSTALAFAAPKTAGGKSPLGPAFVGAGALSAGALAAWGLSRLTRRR